MGKKKHIDHEPAPQPGAQRIRDLVMADIMEKSERGREKYGEYLEAHNGRDALADAYQEALDMCMYLKQVLVERDEGRLPKAKHLNMAAWLFSGKVNLEQSVFIFPVPAHLEHERELRYPFDPSTRTLFVRDGMPLDPALQLARQLDEQEGHTTAVWQTKIE